MCSLHLAVESPNPATLRPLYRVASGTSSTPHYGLTLARIVPLPLEVLSRAEQVARGLEHREANQKRMSDAVLAQRRRRLILGLRENLEQARMGQMEGDALSGWLRELQKDFVERMDALRYQHVSNGEAHEEKRTDLAEDECGTASDEEEENATPAA